MHSNDGEGSSEIRSSRASQHSTAAGHHVSPLPGGGQQLSICLNWTIRPK